MSVARPLTWCATAASMLLAGCYTLEPARRSAPEPGSVIALDITDQGRVALGGLIGPALSQVEGRVISMDSSEYVLGVTGVRFLAGGEQVWHGETVHIKSEYVGSRYERRFSAGRTAVLGAVAVGAVVLVAAKGLHVLGQGTTDKTPGDTAQTQRAPRRP